MRRATPWFLLLLTVAVLLPLRSHGSAQRVNSMNGIGLIDYTGPPRFKVGDWVRYRVTGSSDLGEADDYDVTVLIAGEETFWGEDLFWVETWTKMEGRPEGAVATAMSYSAFGDTAWLQNFQKYARKTIHDINEDGSPQQTVMRRLNTFNRRDVTRRDLTLHTDTLGADTVHVPKGLFHCTKVIMRQGVGMNADVGDSTVRNEVRENRTMYYSREVPITSVAREDIENMILRRTWKAGESQNAVTLTRERAVGIARLVDFGNGDLVAQITPAYARKGINRGGAKATPASKSKTPSKTKTTGASRGRP